MRTHQVASSNGKMKGDAKGLGTLPMIYPHDVYRSISLFFRCDGSGNSAGMTLFPLDLTHFLGLCCLVRSCLGSHCLVRSCLGPTLLSDTVFISGFVCFPSLSPASSCSFSLLPLPRFFSSSVLFYSLADSALQRSVLVDICYLHRFIFSYGASISDLFLVNFTMYRPRFLNS